MKNNYPLTVMEIDWSNPENPYITFYPGGDKYITLVPTLKNGHSVFVFTPDLRMIEVSLLR